MKNVKTAIGLLIFTLAIVTLLGSSAIKRLTMKNDNIMTSSDEETAIRALEDRFIEAFNAGDIDAIMKNYIPDKSLIVFDVVPRKKYHGADEYRKDWVDFFSHFRDLPKINISDLQITADTNIGFSNSIQHISGVDKEGQQVDRTVRVTDGYRKINGKWLIVQEHISVPVDLKTGKAALTGKP